MRKWEDGAQNVLSGRGCPRSFNKDEMLDFLWLQSQHLHGAHGAAAEVNEVPQKWTEMSARSWTQDCASGRGTWLPAERVVGGAARSEWEKVLVPVVGRKLEWWAGCKEEVEGVFEAWTPPSCSLNGSEDLILVW